MQQAYKPYCSSQGQERLQKYNDTSKDSESSLSKNMIET